MLNGIIEKLGQFVDSLGLRWRKVTTGRRGEDDYSGFLWILGLLLLILDIFLKKWSLLILGVILVGYGLFRCFSGASFHDRENEIFHRVVAALGGLLRRIGGVFTNGYHEFQETDKKAVMEQLKNKVVPDEETKQQRAEEKAQKNAYYVFECPGCKQKVRIPNRGKKGRVAIVCPACHTRFVRMRW